MALSRRPSSKDLLAQANKARERIKAEEEEERRLRQAAEEAKAQEEEDERRHTELSNRVAGLREEKKAKESAIAASRATYSSTIYSLNNEARVRQDALQARIDELQKESMKIEASHRLKVQEAESHHNTDTEKYLAEIEPLDGKILKAQAELEEYETLHLEPVDDAPVSGHEPIDDSGAADYSTTATSAHGDVQNDGTGEATRDEGSDIASGQQNEEQPGPAELVDQDKTDGSDRTSDKPESEPGDRTVTQEAKSPIDEDPDAAPDENGDDDDDEDPVRPGPRRRQLRASSISSSNLLIDDETPIHPSKTMVMSLDDQWHEIKCYVCGANRSRARAIFFDVAELLKHMFFSHFPQGRPLSRKDTLLKGSQRIFGPEDVKSLQAGGDPATGLIRMTRGTSSDAKSAVSRNHARAPQREDDELEVESASVLEDFNDTGSVYSDDEYDSDAESEGASSASPQSPVQRGHRPRPSTEDVSDDDRELVKRNGHHSSKVKEKAISLSKSSHRSPQGFAFGADLLTDDIAPPSPHGLDEASQKTQQYSLSKLLESIPPGQSRTSAHKTAAGQMSMNFDQQPDLDHVDASFRAQEVETRARAQDQIKEHSSAAALRQQRVSVDHEMIYGAPWRPEEISATSEPAPADETIRRAPAAEPVNNQLAANLGSLQTIDPPSQNIERPPRCTSDQVIPGVFSGRSKTFSQEPTGEQEVRTVHAPPSTSKLGDGQHSQLAGPHAPNAMETEGSAESSMETAQHQAEILPESSTDTALSSQNWAPAINMGESDDAPNINVLHGKYSNTRHFGNSWYFIRCKVCHANSHSIDEGGLIYYNGLKGLRSHATYNHGLTAQWRDLGSWCEERLIEHNDVARFYQDGELPHSIELPYGGNGNGFRNGRRYSKRPSSRTSQNQGGHRIAFPGDPRLKGREGQSKLKLDTAVPGAQSAYSVVARLEGPTRDDGDRPPNAAREAREVVFSRPVKSNTMVAPPSGRFDYASGVQMHTSPYVPRERSRSSPPPGELPSILGGPRNSSKSPPRKKQKHGEKDAETGSIFKRFCSPAEANHEKRDNSR